MRIFLFLFVFSFFLFANQGENWELPGYDCGDCHGYDGWTILSLSGFNHQETNFPLEGSHQHQSCNACHVGNTVAEKHQFRRDSRCFSCHLDVHMTVLGDECIQCHGMDSWIVTSQTFDHNLTPFSLWGAHEGLPCQSCHAPGDMTSYSQISTDCYSCHYQDYNQTNAPSHLQAGVSTECIICHSVYISTWTPSSFDHDVQTNYVLTGSHEIIECFQCHSGGAYNLPTSCDGCHSPGQLAETNYEVSSFDHTSHNIINQCENCHLTDQWTQSIFDHLDFASLACEQCHLPEYVFSQSPSHNNDNIRSQCELCHVNTDWTIENFEHSVDQTDFALIGLHIPLLCEDCHTNNQYQGIGNTCQNSGCHLTDFQTAIPNHQLYGYPIDYCIECHSEFGWTPNHYNHALMLACSDCHIPDYNNAANPPHSKDTGFSLFCDQCHLTTDTWEEASFYHEGITSDCWDCHSQEYASTTSPNHTQAGYGTVCTDCHTSFINWNEIQMDHSFYLISDDHIDLTCSECHSEMEFQPSCWNCHESDFFVEHSDGQSVTCWNCHTTGGWEDVSFDHIGIINGCIECHQNDYQSNHSSGFPTDCESCHNTEGWESTNFSHSFPINPPHQNTVSETCEHCHINGNTSEFTCSSGGCHSFINETSEHCENGPQDCEDCNGSTYPYFGVVSLDCYSCHPSGDEDDCENRDNNTRSRISPKKDPIKTR